MKNRADPKMIDMFLPQLSFNTSARPPMKSFIQFSFYVKVVISYFCAGVRSDYEYFFLCEQHEKTHTKHKQMNDFMKFQHICTLCPQCPDFVSEHYHLPAKHCNNRCIPFRFFHRPSMPVCHATTRHNCWRDHLIEAHVWNIILRENDVPPHFYSPFFQTETQHILAMKRFVDAQQFTHQHPVKTRTLLDGLDYNYFELPHPPKTPNLLFAGGEFSHKPPGEPRRRINSL